MSDGIFDFTPKIISDLLSEHNALFFVFILRLKPDKTRPVEKEKLFFNAGTDCPC